MQKNKIISRFLVIFIFVLITGLISYPGWNVNAQENSTDTPVTTPEETFTPTPFFTETPSPTNTETPDPATGSVLETVAPSETLVPEMISASSLVTSGWFNIIWGDTSIGTSGITETQYILTDTNGISTRLALGGALEDSILLYNRKYVTIQGTWQVSAQGVDSILAVESIALAKGPATDIQPLELSGSHPFISVMCKFKDVSTEPKNLAYFQGMYSSSYPGLDHYWRQVSYDAANIAGSNAVGWYTLPQNRSYYVYDIDGNGDLDLNFDRAARDCTALADPYVNFATYRYGGINLMFNTDLDGYAWGGSHSLSLDGVNQVWPMTWEPPWGYSEITVMSHEMGHAFGLPHSSGHSIVYNNVWDVMGDTWDNCSASTSPTYGCLGQHINAFHKDLLGWIPSAQKFTLPYNSEATVTLEQLALPSSSNYKLVKVPILGSSTRYYTVEVRNLTGYDVKLRSKAVIIHDVNTIRAMPSDVVDPDGTNYTGDAGAIWLAGEVFNDPANNVTITILSENTTGFVVKVKSGIVPTPSLTPTITLTPSPVPPAGYGTYDERDFHVVYAGNWIAQPVNGNYLNTEKYSNQVGSTASFTFNGENVSVIYRGYPNVFGALEVKIDNVVVDTINQNTSSQTLQNRWTSDDLGSGTHTLVLTHKTGIYVSLDGITVSGPPTPTPTFTQTFTPTNTRTPTPTLTPLPPVGYGTYDERDVSVVYAGSWVAQAVKGNYLNTEKYSYQVGSSATFTFSGENVSVIYRGYPNVFGTMEVKIDNVVVDTINQNTPSQTLQNRWTSDDLGSGTHTLILTHKTGTYVSLDGITVSGPPTPTPTFTQTFTPTNTRTPTPTLTPLPPVGYGTYDERVTQIVYSGSWVAQPVNGNYINTEKYSYRTSSSATFTFSGENVSVIYRGYPNVFGTLEVKIDDVVVATINQNTPSQTLQNRWTSDDLGAGTHTLVLTHKTGTYISLDGIIVSGPPTPTPTFTQTFTPTNTRTPTPTLTPLPPVGAGTYDERDVNVVYGGSWVAQPVSRNYMKTEKYSNLAGSTAVFTFSGTRITVIYRGYPNVFGTMRVEIDGSQVAIINQSTPAQQFQQQWVSTLLTNGTHTIRLTHLTAPYVSLDGFRVE